MDYDQAIEYIHSVSWLGSKPGLERTKRLLAMMGDPQDKLKFVHITGTNGKGSVSSMTAAVLKQAGLKTGLYTSPFILRFNDRMRVNGRPISDGKLAEITEYVKQFADKMEDCPTEFELVTAIGFEYFFRCKCDVVVLEVGMGGELDSTNVIKRPLLSVITKIGLDHTKILGDTVERITRTKCGIIKGGDTVAFGGEASTPYVTDECEKRDSALHLTDTSSIIKKKYDTHRICFDYKKHKDISIPLVAAYQYENAALALDALDVLSENYFDISEDDIKKGLRSVKWKARFEFLKRRPVVLFDGGHNPQGVAAAKESFEMHFGSRKAAVIFGAMADKEVGKMLDIIAPICGKMYTVTVDNPRAMSSSDLKKLAEEHGIKASDALTPANALMEASAEKTLLILGSLYMYPEIIDSANRVFQRK